MKKNTMIKILSLLAVVLSMTACSNTEAPDSSSITTTVTTTTVNTTTAPVVTPSEISSTSLSESVPVVSDETTITTTEQEVNTSTSTEKIDGSTSIETTSTSATTTKKPPTTVTTTTKATTTKKPATVTTTTTKKATTTTKKTTTTAKTTTKKTTTTAKTTTKTTTTTVQKANLTQADINKLVKELQEYSNSKAEYVTSNWTKYRGYGTDYTTLEEFYAWLCEDKTPSNSSWDSPNIFYLDSGLWNYSSVYNRMIDALNWQYESSPNSHIVIYVEYHPNGYIYNGTLYNTPDECYVFYCLR